MRILTSILLLCGILSGLSLTCLNHTGKNHSSGSNLTRTEIALKIKTDAVIFNNDPVAVLEYEGEKEKEDEHPHFTSGITESFNSLQTLGHSFHGMKPGFCLSSRIKLNLLYCTFQI